MTDKLTPIRKLNRWLVRHPLAIIVALVVVGLGQFASTVTSVKTVYDMFFQAKEDSGAIGGIRNIAEEQGQSITQLVRDSNSAFKEIEATKQLAMGASKEIESLTSSIESANQQITQQHEAAARLRAELVGELEKLRLRAVELERDLSDRVFENQQMAAEALRKFQGTAVEIRYTEDAESEKLAGQIALVVHYARWKLVSQQPSSHLAKSRGISLEVRVGSKEKFFSPENHNRTPAYAEPWFAALSLLKQELEKSHLKVTSAGGVETGEPGGTILINVGARPNASDRRIEAYLEAAQKRGAEGGAAKNAENTGVIAEGNTLVLRPRPKTSSVTFANRAESVRILAKFPKMGVSILHLPNAASQDAANQLSLLVESAGWKLVQRIAAPPGNNVPSGVTVSATEPAEDAPWQEAANLLVAELKKTNLDVKTGPPDRLTHSKSNPALETGMMFFPGLVIIRIGLISAETNPVQ